MMNITRLPFFTTVLAASLLGACAPIDDAPDAELAASDSDALASPITWRGGSVSALDQATGPGTSIVVAKPAGTVAGDVEVAAVASYATINVTPPSGWTLVKAQADTGTVANSGVKTSVFVRVAGAGEPASYSFALSGSARAVATVQAYANVDTANPIDAVASAAETTTRTTHGTPSIVTTRDGAVLMGIFGILSPLEPASNTSGITYERVDRSSGNAGSWGVGLAVYDSNPRAAAGTEGSRTDTSSSATDGATMTLLALRPKATATTPVETLFGAAFNPHSAARFDELNTMFGQMGVTRSFDGGSGVGPFLNSYQAMDIARGAASAYSFKYLPAQVIAGQHDAALTSFFQGIQDDHPVYWTYWHEPDDELYVDHTFTPSDYRAAWAHIKQIANQVKASRPNMKAYATLIIMEYSMRPNQAPNRPLLGPNGMYPGDDVIDVFGVDSYNSAAEDGGIASVSDKFGKVIDFAQAHGKPWAIGEIGSCPVTGNAQGRADFLTNSIEYWISRNYPPVYVSYFNLDWSTCDYRLDSDAAAKAVWRTAVEEGLSAFQ